MPVPCSYFQVGIRRYGQKFASVFVQDVSCAKFVIDFALFAVQCECSCEANGGERRRTGVCLGC